MCCIVALMGLIGPRVALLYAWIFTNQVDQAFNKFYVPLIGLLVLPWTTLFYAIAYAPVVGVQNFGVFIVLLGVLLDISTWAAGPRARSN